MQRLHDPNKTIQDAEDEPLDRIEEFDEYHMQLMCLTSKRCPHELALFAVSGMVRVVVEGPAE